MRLPLLSLVLAVGCATPQVTTFRSIKPNLRVQVDTSENVNAICHLDVNGIRVQTYADDGSLITNDEKIIGCYDGFHNIIYLPYNPPWDLVRHELCHAAGEDRSTCEDWDND